MRDSRCSAPTSPHLREPATHCGHVCVRRTGDSGSQVCGYHVAIRKGTRHNGCERLSAGNLESSTDRIRRVFGYQKVTIIREMTVTLSPFKSANLIYGAEVGQG